MTNEAVRILDFEPRFEHQAREVIQQVYREFGFGPDVTPDSDPDLFGIPRVYADRARFWVAVDGEQLVGTGAIRPKTPDIGEVKRMYLLAAYRGRGIGLALLEKAVGFGREQGDHRLHRDTVAGLKQAIHLYERYGFQKIGVHSYLTDYELIL